MVLASVGLPLLNGFIGEFLVLNGAFQDKADLWDSRGHGRDLERGIPSLDVPARFLRKGDASGEQFHGDLSGLEKAAVWPCACRRWSWEWRRFCGWSD
jgi:hypothetical protein